MSSEAERRPLLPEVVPSSNDGAGEVEHQGNGNANGTSNGETSNAALLVIMGSMWVGVFLAALDSTIVATLASPISTSFESFTLMSWLASAYLVANAAIQPISGKLTDIFSRGTGLVFANIFFAVGTLICGLAKSEGVMIFGRVVAGLGGGCLQTVTVFVCSDLVPLRQRGLWQGLTNIVWGLGSGLGGVFGGLINDTLGWRYAFLIQIPMIILSGILAYFVVNIPVQDHEVRSRIKRVDFLGSFTLCATLILLLIGLNSGGNVVAWDHPLVISTISISGATLLLFIYIEDRVAPEPVIPVHLLLHRTVMSGCLANWFISMSLYATLYFIPIYFQVRGFSTTQAGARLIPSSVGISIGSLGAGFIMRATGKYRLLNVGVEASLLLGYALIAGTLSLSTPEVPPYIYLFFVGLGYGGLLTISLVAIIGAVDIEYHAVIASASYAFRSTGSTIGITVVSAVFQNILKDQLWEKLGNRDDAAELIKKLRDSIDAIKGLPPSLKEQVLQVYMGALQGVWFTILALGIVGAVASLFMKEHTLHRTVQRDR